MVKWQGRRGSDNVEDGRRRAAAGVGGGGAILMIIRFVLSRFGVRGIVFLVIAAVGLSAIGMNPLALLSGQQANVASAPTSAQDDQTAQFVSVVLAETENVWEDIFREAGGTYPAPKLRLFSRSVSSACGHATAASGPFYCPADQKAYLDTSFFNELSQRFGAPGDFAAAYVIAHEVGHHVQTVTGTSSKVRAQQRTASKAESNALQVRMELQADCYSGVWANRADAMSDFLDEGDIEEGLRAASAIGDDTLQRNAGRRVTPESFTHGTSEQRQRWFMIGYRSGDPNKCDTFSTNSL